MEVPLQHGCSGTFSPWRWKSAPLLASSRSCISEMTAYSRLEPYCLGAMALEFWMAVELSSYCSHPFLRLFSIIHRNDILSMDGATLLSSLVCWNTVQPNYSTLSLPLSFSVACALVWSGHMNYFSFTWKMFGHGSKMKGRFRSVVLV